MYLTVGVEASAAAGLVKALRRAGLEVVPVVTARLFPATDACVEVTHDGCACGLSVGPPGAASLNDRRRRRFERRGSSAVRVARILTEAPPRRMARQAIALRSVLARFAPVRICYQRIRGCAGAEQVHADVEVIVTPG